MNFFLFDFNFSIRFAFGRLTGNPEYSFKTVVTMKKTKSIKMISGIEAVGISLEILVFFPRSILTTKSKLSSSICLILTSTLAKL